MTTFLEQADHLVRNHPANKELMELSFGCEVFIDKDATIGPFRIVGKGWANDFECQYFYSEGGGHNSVGQNKKDITEIFGKPPQLQHYLRVLKNQEHHLRNISFSDTTMSMEHISTGVLIQFDLTTGAPATEADAEAFIKLVS